MSCDGDFVRTASPALAAAIRPCEAPQPFARLPVSEAVLPGALYEYHDGYPSLLQLAFRRKEKRELAKGCFALAHLWTG